MRQGRDKLAARRRAVGHTQESLAAILNVAVSTVARWEQGGGCPLPVLRRPLAGALSVSLDELDRLLGGSGAPEREGTADDDPWMSNIDLGPAQPVDAAYVTTVRESTQELVALDGQYGGDDIVQLAVRVFRASSRHLALGTYVPGREHDLQAAVGELGEVAAWIAYDANQQALSRRLNQEALLMSRLAGDREMELFELSNLAMQATHLHRPAEALGIAEHALADDGLSPRTAALFHVRKARALGQMGQRHGGFDALDMAATLLADGVATRDPAWTWWIDDGELAWHRAMCLTDLNEWHAAVDLFRRALELRPADGTDRVRRRVRYNDLAHLLEALVTVEAWREAEDTVADIVPYVGEVSSARTTVLLRRTMHCIEESRARATPTLVDCAAAFQRLLDQLS